MIAYMTFTSGSGRHLLYADIITIFFEVAHVDLCLRGRPISDSDSDIDTVDIATLKGIKYRYIRMEHGGYGKRTSLLVSTVRDMSPRMTPILPCTLMSATTWTTTSYNWTTMVATMRFNRNPRFTRFHQLHKTRSRSLRPAHRTLASLIHRMSTLLAYISAQLCHM
ncbi:hypothetical protein Scep_017045 [Stephania cephalantha]|uniref:Uncharacterized protein n=1 Tax=Stephania cephalantha TaxID=152367 RepID=A0AAP0IQQ4_9MAGN